MDTQLEFNFENKTEQELEILQMQKLIKDLDESMGKVRRKLFAEMGVLNKKFSELSKENEELKEKIREMKNETKKTQWIYGQEGYLFNETQYRKSAY